MRIYFITTRLELSQLDLDAIIAINGNQIGEISGDRYLIKCNVKPQELIDIEIAEEKTFTEYSYVDIREEQTSNIQGRN